MVVFRDIEKSPKKARILRYKADLEALQKVVGTLEQPHGLPELLAMHGDLKSRCLIPIIAGTLQEVAVLRAQLPPLSDWYRENTQPRPQPQHPEPDVTVSDWNFREQRKACERTLDEVKERLEWLDGHLEDWHVQEAGKISDVEVRANGVYDWSATWNHNEATIWSSYKEGYKALMAPLENPEFSSNNSHSKLFSHRTLVGDSHSVEVMAEIDQFLAAHDKVWTYCEFVEKIPTKVDSFTSMISQLPTEYDLRRRAHYFIDDTERRW
jgi:hypothetical protein